MTMRKIRSFNLNSLPMLRELLRHGSVTKAAAALNVSQPALSAALKNLREHFKDELVRRRDGAMFLTAKGESLLQPLEQALSSIEALVLENDDAVPRDVQRIKIATTDHSMHLLSAPLARVIIEDAPHLGVQFLNVGGHSVAQLMSGAIEMIITPRSMMTTGLADSRALREVNSELLMSHRLVCIGRNDDAELTAGLSLAEYLARPHVSLALDVDRDISVERVALAGLSLPQNDVLLTACYSTLPAIVATTGCLAVLPEGMAKTAALMYPVQWVESPLPMPALELVMVWHRRNDNDGRIIQLREILKACATLADAPPLD
jgi:LysR family transcriptional regulator, nod-box dependent transcriptional activator